MAPREGAVSRMMVIDCCTRGSSKLKTRFIRAEIFTSTITPLRIVKRTFYFQIYSDMLLCFCNDFKLAVTYVQKNISVNVISLRLNDCA